MKMPYEDCPRFRECSVNVCPLDPDHAKRNRLSDEPKCTFAKIRRIRIAEMHPGVLPMGGMTGREFAGKRVWEAKPEAERQAAMDRGRRRFSGSSPSDSGTTGQA